MTRRRWPRILGGLALAALVGLLLLLAVAYRPAIAAIAPPPASSFAAADIAHGEVLAREGNCTSCHSAQGGRPYAGGVPLKTQFGTIYGSNLTPDPDHGIGRWSLPAFTRAMRRGVARDGSHLYPAFPYDHFSSLTDADLRALYAYLMTRPAVSASPPANRLIPPLGFRPVLIGWKLLFFRPHSFLPDPAHDAVWNRGRYLGEGLAHCGGCHSPRGVLGNEQRDHAYAGGWSEGWYAPPLNARSPAVRAWTADRLVEYLRTGLSHSHAAAGGPMGEVAGNLSQVPEADVRSIATYYASLMAGAPAARHEPALADHGTEAARLHPEGAAIFAGACASCHAPGAPMLVGGRPPMMLGSQLHEDNPRDTIQVILKGLNPPVGSKGPYMPNFADTLTDKQIAEVIAYLNTRWGSASWADVQGDVAKARKEGQ